MTREQMIEKLAERVAGWHQGERSGRQSTGVLINELLAALRTEPPPMLTGWQDISTAPKDGTVVLLWATFHEDYGYTERRDGMIRARFIGTRWEPAEGVGQYWHGMTPKLWSPLPAPPPTGADR